MRKTFITSVILLFFLFIFSAPKAFAKCSFLIQSTYTTSDDISITANNLRPNLIYSLLLYKLGAPRGVGTPSLATTDTLTFSIGKLAPGLYNLELTGKQGNQTVDSCLGVTNEGDRAFTIFVPKGQARTKPVLWSPNANGSAECVQSTSGLFNTKEECEGNISRNASNPDNLPAFPPPCAKWVFAFPVDHPDASRLNNIEIPPNDPSYTLDDKLKFGKCAAVDTAIGKIDTDPAGFVKRIFSLVLGIAGGIALILIIISGYKFMTSQGNPEAVKGATEQVTSAIVGLLFIIFAFVILQIIGVDILRIPGFSK